MVEAPVFPKPVIQEISSPFLAEENVLPDVFTLKIGDQVVFQFVYINGIPTCIGTVAQEAVGGYPFVIVKDVVPADSLAEQNKLGIAAVMNKSFPGGMSVGNDQLLHVVSANDFKPAVII